MKRFFITIMTLALLFSCVLQPAQAAWVQDANGWCYITSNGQRLTNTWHQDSVGWCYLGADGYMVYNRWVQDSVGWCYVGSNGYMVYNQWVQDSVGWCYVGSNGYMLYNQWVMDSVGWCYLGSDGYAVTNCWKQDSVGWCYLNNQGSMTKNAWVLDGNSWYYCNADGYMVTGWQTIGGDQYYFYSNGVMAANTVVDGISLGQNGNAVQSNMAQSYIDYSGKWHSTTQYHYMSLEIESGIMYLEYSCLSGNATRIAMVSASITLSDIENNKATFNYSDDGWGNSGTLVLDFSQANQITCTATTTYQNPSALWSIIPGSRIFVQ